jgi:hypothetical protein
MVAKLGGFHGISPPLLRPDRATAVTNSEEVDFLSPSIR